MELKSKKIEIEPELFKTISKIAKNKNITEDKALAELIEKGIETTEIEIIEEKIEKISDSNEGITIQRPRKSGKALKTKEIIGIFEAKESFNSVEEIKKMENGESG